MALRKLRAPKLGRRYFGASIRRNRGAQIALRRLFSRPALLPSQAHSRATTVLIDEFNACGLQSAA
jgi:hypothetical protein